MKFPAPAPVAPRVLSPTTGEALPLEHEVRILLDERHYRAIRLVGGAGSGKTTALAHLEAVLGPLAPALLDDPRPEELERTIRLRGVTVYATLLPCRVDQQLDLLLAPWGLDEVLEYLMAVHPTGCATVMARLRQAGDSELAQGNPELWRTALDRMAASEAATGVRSALRYEIGALLLDDAHWKLAGEYCLAELIAEGLDGKAHYQGLPPPEDRRRWLADAQQRSDPGFSKTAEATRIARLLRHRPIRLVLAADAIRNGLIEDESHPFLSFPLPAPLIDAAGPLLATDGACIERLHESLDRPDECQHPMAASLLFAAKKDWRPAHARLNLAGGRFRGALWKEANLATANLTGADLAGADLTQAVLDRAMVERACFRRAVLHRANLLNLRAEESDFQFADMSLVQAIGADFRGAQLSGVRGEGAVFVKAILTSADLAMGRFQRASFENASLVGARVDDADFTGASFFKAILNGLDLTKAASLQGAVFARARLRLCSFEGLDLPQANFRGADLNGAFLTGSTMRGANLHGADLGATGLADIDWEGADLRHADLRGCSFHLGSTRSGLVGSPIACEGSKTGFYTDDFHDQQFKSPEEIRKANLCRADLRFANLEGVDFYLVDLRGAQFDAKYKSDLRRSGAILVDP